MDGQKGPAYRRTGPFSFYRENRRFEGKRIQKGVRDELLIPVPIGIPGVKLGLANMVTVWVLYALGPVEALAVNGMRILLAGFLFGSLSMILYSLAGAALSFLCMYLAEKSGMFSVTGVMHNVGQLLVAVCVLETVSLLYYGPVLLAAGLITGLLIGIIAREAGRRIPGKM